MKKKIQIVGVGNAIVDLFAQVSDDFILDNGLNLGAMNLTDAKQAEALLKKVEIKNQVAGGSAANTIVGLAQLGLSTAYFGKVCDDKFGQFFVQDLRNNAVHFRSKLEPVSRELSTGRSIILITPDGERTMNTYLGITEFFSEDDLDKELLRNSEWLYLEGYRFDGYNSRLAFTKATNIMRKACGKIALSLSDPFCIERHRTEFLELISGGLDIVFCNESELKSLTEKDNIQDALVAAANFSCKIICTAAQEGAFIVEGKNILHVPTKMVDQCDATGAGDLFATGFLYGVISNLDNSSCCKIGNALAAKVIQQIGCRIPSEKMLKFKNRSLMGKGGGSNGL